MIYKTGVTLFCAGIGAVVGLFLPIATKAHNTAHHAGDARIWHENKSLTAALSLLHHRTRWQKSKVLRYYRKVFGINNVAEPSFTQIYSSKTLSPAFAGPRKTVMG